MSNKINMNLTCYMCENQKTSVEHVPPLCFFPERKDTPENNDYRKNLITVSSCDVHNSRKSKDDEFMYIVMACNGKANDLAKLHQNTKIDRILKRTPAVFVSLMKAAKPHYSITDGELKESCVWEIDLVRFDKHMSNMANALYYYTYGKKISG